MTTTASRPPERKPCIGREPSVRADARRRYLKAAERERLDAPPAGGEPAEPSLTDRVGDLYENSVVPVREIARLVGVTERTIYKYVETRGWRRRHVCLAREEAVAAANRGRRMRPRAGFAPAKGAGGRFVRREEAGRAHAQGLKALDPQGARRALERCMRAGILSEAAVAEAVAAAQARAEADALEREAQAQLRILETLAGALLELEALRLDAVCAAPENRAQADRGKQGRDIGGSRRTARLAMRLQGSILTAIDRLLARPTR